MEKEKDLRAVITVVGVDRVGIIARITGKLSDLGINILDINQTIMGGSLHDEHDRRYGRGAEALRAVPG